MLCFCTLLCFSGHKLGLSAQTRVVSIATKLCKSASQIAKLVHGKDAEFLRLKVMEHVFKVVDALACVGIERRELAGQTLV